MSLGTLIVAGVLLFVGGGVTGWAVSRDQTAHVVEAQTALIGQIQDAQLRTLDAVSKPMTIDAEIRASLSEVPPACIASLGGDPLGPACLLVECWRRGSSSAQRPECRQVETMALKRMACPATSSKEVQ